MTERAVMRAVHPLEWDLADRLGKALRVSGVSVQAMADELGVGRNTVGNYMAGRTRPSRATLRVWALATGAPLSWLESGGDPEQCAIRDSNPEPAVSALTPVLSIVGRSRPVTTPNEIPTPQVTSPPVRRRRSHLRLLAGQAS